jgi:hypothetical protein
VINEGNTGDYVARMEGMKKYIQNFNGKIKGKKPIRDGRIILKYMFIKQVLSLWIGLIGLNIVR